MYYLISCWWMQRISIKELACRSSLPCGFGGFDRWKLNLIAISGDKLFTAEGRSVKYFPLYSGGSIGDPVSLSFEHSEAINEIRVGNLDIFPVLIVLDDAGGVCIYNSEEPHKYTPFRFINPGATWSSELCSGLGLHTRLMHSSCITNKYLTLISQHSEQTTPTATVILGSNSRNVSIYSLSQLQAQWRTQLQSKNNPKSIDNIEIPIDLTTTLPFTSCQHKHNIPSVSLTACGKYIATASIDYTIRIWDKETTKLLYAAQDMEWIWAVQWIPKSSVKILELSKEDLNDFESFQARIRQKSLQDTYSTLPQFPITVDILFSESELRVYVDEHEESSESEMSAGDDDFDVEDAMSAFHDDEQWNDDYSGMEYSDDEYSGSQMQAEDEETTELLRADSASPRAWEGDRSPDIWNVPDIDMVVNIRAEGDTGVEVWTPIIDQSTEDFTLPSGSWATEENDNNLGWTTEPLEINTIQTTHKGKTQLTGTKCEEVGEEILEEPDTPTFPENISHRSKFQIQRVAGYSTEELLLCGTTRTLYLLDSRLHQLATLQYCVPYSPVMQAYMRNIERLNLIEYIPELSIVVVASQGCAMATIVRIVKFPNGRYELLPERILPDPQGELTGGPITGIACRKFQNRFDYLSYYQLYITFERGEYYCYELRADPISESLDISTKFL